VNNDNYGEGEIYTLRITEAAIGAIEKLFSDNKILDNLGRRLYVEFLKHNKELTMSVGWEEDKI